MTMRVDSVNIGVGVPTPHTRAATKRTGIDKLPQDGPVEVRDPGPRGTGHGSGLVGDYIGDHRHHGGSEQAVYAFAREDLDRWQQRLGRPLRNGFFGENLTTVGFDVNAARVGERWRIGNKVEVVVTVPRIPCATFQGWIDEARWVKQFTEDRRPGTYLRVAVPGFVRGGDPIEVIHRPEHDVTVSFLYRAMTTERDLLREVAAIGADLPASVKVPA